MLIKKEDMKIFLSQLLYLCGLTSLIIIKGYNVTGQAQPHVQRVANAGLSKYLAWSPLGFPADNEAIYGWMKNIK